MAGEPAPLGGGGGVVAEPELPRAATVLVAAPHELVHYGLALMLGGSPPIARCIPARDAESAIALAGRRAPTIALVDIKLGPPGPEAACLGIRAAAPAARVLLLTAAIHLPSRTVAGLGASGFISKAWPSRQILEAVRLASRGQLARPRAGRRANELTDRQHEILQLLADGATNDEIARTLHVSPNTVKQHASALYRKLHARNRADAIGRAQAMGLLV
ncbi:MAG: response regulator transcription factor [Solirubrobacterales bacterium]|nr:response regulator transcription factor [Solirubrobacterales bacterium]